VAEVASAVVAAEVAAVQVVVAAPD